MSVNISIDIDDIYNEIDSYDLNKLVRYGIADGVIDIDDYIEEKFIKAINNEDFNTTCSEVASLYYRMTNEEVELIEKIRNKYL